MLGERTLFLRLWGPDKLHQGRDLTFWYFNWDRRNKRWLHWEIRSSMCCIGDIVLANMTPFFNGVHALDSMKQKRPKGSRVFEMRGRWKTISLVLSVLSLSLLLEDQSNQECVKTQFAVCVTEECCGTSR